MILPEIYKNKLDENIKTNEKAFIGSAKDIREENKSEDIFKELPVRVNIRMKNREFITIIVGKTNNYLISKNRDVFYIKDIISITKI